MRTLRLTVLTLLFCVDNKSQKWDSSSSLVCWADSVQWEQLLNRCEEFVCVWDSGGVVRPRAWLTAGGEAVKLLHGRSTVSGVKHKRVFQAKLRFSCFLWPGWVTDIRHIRSSPFSYSQSRVKVIIKNGGNSFCSGEYVTQLANIQQNDKLKTLNICYWRSGYSRANSLLCMIVWHKRNSLNTHNPV